MRALPVWAFVAIYLVAIVAANLLVARLGPSAAIPIAFLFIGLDLTSRDTLHEAWRGRRLWLRMAALIAAGSILSYLLNRASGRVALASFVAFAAAGLADALVYAALGARARYLRVNGSNVVSAAVDSAVFPTLAFGQLMPLIVLGQFAAKVVGGALWFLILPDISKRRVVRHDSGSAPTVA